MANLVDLAAEVKNDGYSQVNAEAKVCQDIVLKAISESSLSRNVTIKAGAVVKDCLILAYTTIGEGVHIEGQVVDKWVTIKNTKEIVADPEEPGYINRDDVL
jgi:ADP-glucose pyrophosphorylase